MNEALTMILLAALIGGGAFLALTVVGVVLIARRSRRDVLARPTPRELTEGNALLAADEAVRLASDELDFAVAQFGEADAAPYRAAITRARADLTRAFELQQRLTTTPNPDPRRVREWSREVASIARRVTAELETERRRYTERRSSEAHAAETIAALRARRDAVAARADAAERSLSEIASEYRAELLDSIRENPAEARRVLTEADAELDRAAAQIAASPVSAVTGILQGAQELLARAENLVDAVTRRRDELAAADAGLVRLRTEAHEDLAEARALRDNPPDPDSADALTRAMAAVDDVLRAATPSGPRDPIAALDALVEVTDDLDIALAATRNQQRRLDGARGALSGALLSARTQIAAVRDYISAHHGRVGVDARTRLAEAERQLLLAENEADPVAALDAARRAATHARDADALARYRG